MLDQRVAKYNYCYKILPKGKNVEQCLILNDGCKPRGIT
jgi:hypothetical protein